jgi:hypothetical protein
MRECSRDGGDKEVGFESLIWMELAQDHIQWRALLMTALKLVLATTVSVLITNEVTYLIKNGP